MVYGEQGALFMIEHGHVALAERLERGELIHYPIVPFPLPGGAEYALLLDLKLAAFSKTSVTIHPATGPMAFAKPVQTTAKRFGRYWPVFPRT
jgi:hypothetical protein